MIFYGRDSYELAAGFFSKLSGGTKGEIAMVGYPVLNTLSDHGHVNRGICKTDANGSLTNVEEYVNIQREDDGMLHGNALNGTRKVITEDALVSMNFRVFGPDFFGQLENSFIAFLEKSGTEIMSEFFIPTVVDDLIRSGEVRCTVLETSSQWFGVTYPGDKPVVYRVDPETDRKRASIQLLCPDSKPLLIVGMKIGAVDYIHIEEIGWPRETPGHSFLSVNGGFL